MTWIDWKTVASAAGAGLAIIVAGAVLSGALVRASGGWIVWLFLAVVLAGFTMSGAVAGKLRDDTPIVHGALAAAATSAAAMLIGLAAATLRDQAVSVAAIPVTGLLAVTAGVGGSLVAERANRWSLKR